MSEQFMAWLENTDNGTIHYNPNTNEKSPSIGFSPYDCYMDDLMSIEELFNYFVENVYRK